ncbi:uncharacterized protein LOC142236182 [Haematobia irritans]|uniref:uncharacterized protein LOC142236182 n=1 Tax=Haematobia irritans TaxID=7368 RepID=UPI003F4FAC71
MLAAGRSFRFLVSHCRPPVPLYTWSIKTQYAPIMDLKTTTTWYVRPPMIASYSKDSKSESQSSKSESQANSIPPGKSSDPSNSKALSSSQSSPIDDSPIQPPNIKLPSRDKVEKYFFTSLVYIWDFCYYVFCLSLKLIDTYILKNPTLQENWKKLTKRLDEQREAIKSKK